MNGTNYNKTKSLIFTPLIGLYKKQQQILKSISEDDHKFNIIKGSRQAGKSILLQHCLIYLGSLKHNQTIAYISPSNIQSKKAYDNIMARLPEQLIKKNIASDSDRNIVLINDSKLEFRTAGSKFIRGSSYSHLVLDEFSFINEEFYNADIKPTIAAKPKARVFIASTPLGRNMFYLMYTAGQNPLNRRYKSYDLLYTDNPYYDVNEVEINRKEMPENIFRQEYLGSFEFGKSSVFGDFESLQIQNQYLNPDPNHQHFFGLDVSGEGEDKTVLYIINELGIVDIIYECKETNFLLQAQELLPYIRKYNAKGYVEKNGLGKGMYDLLLNTISDNCYGFTSTNDSKQLLVREFLASMKEGMICLPTIYLCSKLDNQMALYEVDRSRTGKLSYHHQIGQHDDYVDAMLLANHARINLGTGTGISTISFEYYNGNSYSEKSEDYSDSMFFNLYNENLPENPY